VRIGAQDFGIMQAGDSQQSDESACSSGGWKRGRPAATGPGDNLSEEKGGSYAMDLEFRNHGPHR